MFCTHSQLSQELHGNTCFLFELRHVRKKLGVRHIRLIPQPMHTLATIPVASLRLALFKAASSAVPMRGFTYPLAPFDELTRTEPAAWPRIASDAVFSRASPVA